MSDGYIRFYCQQCATRNKVPEKFAGTKARCPSCSYINQVPQIEFGSTSDVEALGFDAHEPESLDHLAGSSDPFSKLDEMAEQAETRRRRQAEPDETDFDEYLGDGKDGTTVLEYDVDDLHSESDIMFFDEDDDDTR